jgi:hypothetical protein
MSKGDPTMTAYIIKKLNELRTKTHGELKAINAVAQTALNKKNYEANAKVVLDKQSVIQDKKAADASKKYGEEVVFAKYKRAQVHREIASLDHIMAQLNAMNNWKSCKSGWVQFGNSCYIVLTAKKLPAWGEQAACLAAGASLIRLDNTNDKQAMTWASNVLRKQGKSRYIAIGFWRSMKNVNQWQYLDGEVANPTSWLPYWYSTSNRDIKTNPYLSTLFSSGYDKLYTSYGSHVYAYPLCEHELKA